MAQLSIDWTDVDKLMAATDAAAAGATACADSVEEALEKMGLVFEITVLLSRLASI